AGFGVLVQPPDIAAFDQRDVVFECNAIEVHLKAQWAAVETGGRFDRGRGLLTEIAVADFVAFGGEVRAVGEELDRGGRAFSPCERRADEPIWRRAYEYAGGGADI